MKTFVLLAAAAVILAGTGAQGQVKLKIGIIAPHTRFANFGIEGH